MRPLSGSPRRHGLRWEMTQPKAEFLGDDEQPTGGQVLPVYPLTEGLHQVQMRRIVWAAVDDFAEVVEEVFSAALLDKLTHRAHILEFIGQPGSRVDQQCPKVPTACR